jgi:hypothetical protein
LFFGRSPTQSSDAAKVVAFAFSVAANLLHEHLSPAGTGLEDDSAELQITAAVKNAKRVPGQLLMSSAWSGKVSTTRTSESIVEISEQNPFQ